MEARRDGVRPIDFMLASMAATCFKSLARLASSFLPERLRRAISLSSCVTDAVFSDMVFLNIESGGWATSEVPLAES